MAVKVEFQADVSSAVQSIKKLERANAEAAKSGDTGSVVQRGRMAQDALNRAKAVRNAAQAAKEETEAQIKLQAAALATAKADAKGADASTEAGKAKLQNLKEQQEAMDRLLDRARELKKQVTGGDELIGRAQNAARPAMADVSAASQKIRENVQYKATVKNETASGFRSIIRGARAASQEIQERFQAVGRRIKNIFGGVKGAFAAVAGFAGVRFGLAEISKEIDRLDNLSKLSRSLGMTGEQMQVLQYAADSANVPIEQLNNAIPKVSKVISDAGRGSSEAAGKLDRLNLSLEDLQGKSTYEQLQMVAGAISRIQDPTERSARAMEMFGETGAKMVDMLSGLAGAEVNLRAQGGIIDEAQLKAAEDFNQALTNIHRNIVSALMNSGFVKWLADVAEGLNAAATNAGRMEQNGIYGLDRASRTVLDEAVASGRITRRRADELYAIREWRGEVSPQMGVPPELQERFRKEQDEKKKELDALLVAGGFSGIANGADSQTREKSPEELQAEVEKANAEKKKREAAAAAAKAAKEEAERKKKEEAVQKEIAALDKQLRDLGKLNRRQTREEFIPQELEKAQKAAPGQFESRKTDIERAAGEKFDREQRAAEQQEAARREVASLEEEARAARERARMAEYQGDSLRRIGGTIGGTAGVDRYKQEMVRRADTQLKTLQGIYERIDQIKRDNPHLFR